MTESWKIIEGDCLEVLRGMEANTFHACVTSPPYYALRDYKVAGQIGLEKSLGEYIDKLVAVFREVRRVLRDDGVFWLNIGDSYGGSWGNYSGGGRGKAGQRDIGNGSQVPNPAYDGMESFRPATSSAEFGMMLVPFRLAIALADDGWIVRSDVAWAKASPMPESVAGWRWQQHRIKVGSGNRMGSGKQAANRLTAGLNERTEKKAHTTNGRPHGGRAANGKDFDSHAQWIDCPGCDKCGANDGLILRRGSWRPTRSWEHIFMLAKSDKYFADGEAVKTRSSAATESRNKYTRITKTGKTSKDGGDEAAVKHDHESTGPGANLRDVWRLKGEPLKLKHYAAFPPSLPLQCLRASTSERGVCKNCAAQWVRVVSKQARENGGAHDNPFNGNETIGFRPSCRCNADTIPAIVLDPFSGAGTTILAARRLGLRAVGIELNTTYARMARRRLEQDSPLFNGIT